MSPELQPMAVQYYCPVCLYHVSVTSTLHCHWRNFWSRDTDVYLTYIRLGIILTQFYINFSRQEHQICIVQKLRFSSFSLYPLSFFLYRVLLFKFNHVLVHNSTIFEVVFFYFFIQNTYADKKVLKNCEKVCFVKLFSNG